MRREDDATTRVVLRHGLLNVYETRSPSAANTVQNTAGRVTLIYDLVSGESTAFVSLLNPLKTSLARLAAVPVDMVWYVVDLTEPFVHKSTCVELFSRLPVLFLLNKRDLVTPQQADRVRLYSIRAQHMPNRRPQIHGLRPRPPKRGWDSRSRGSCPQHRRAHGVPHLLV